MQLLTAYSPASSYRKGVRVTLRDKAASQTALLVSYPRQLSHYLTQCLQPSGTAAK